MTGPKKKIFIFSFSAIGKDPRVLKQIRALREDYDLTVAGFLPKPEGISRFIEIPKGPAQGRLQIYLSFLKMAFLCSDALFRNPSYLLAMKAISQSGPYQLAIGNDLESIPVIVGGLGNENVAQVILDAHEYKPAQFATKGKIRGPIYTRFWKSMANKLIKKVDYAWVVSHGILDLYKRKNGLKGEFLPNAFPYCELQPSPLLENQVRLIHHGGAMRARRLELMIDAMEHLDDRYTLDFYLTGGGLRAKTYLNELKERAKNNPRIRFHDPVPMDQLPLVINQYDIGVYLLPPSNLNQELALPNKIFEFIQARLAILVGPSVEMERVIRKYQIGAISKDFTPREFAKAISSLSPEEIRQMKQNSMKAALEESSEQYEKNVIRATVARII